MSLFRIVVSIALLLPGTWGSAAAAQQAQDQTQQPADTVPAAPQPVAIAAADVSRAAEQTTTSLDQISSSVSPSPNVVDVQGRLPELDDSVRTESAVLGDTLSPQLSTRRLEAMRQQWRRYKATLNGWRGILESRSQSLLASRDTLAHLRATWDLTRDSAVATGYPEALVNRIDEVRRDIVRVEAELDERISAVLTLQDGVSQEDILVSSVLDRIGTAEQRAQARLLTRDGPPIWGAGRVDSTLALQASSSWQDTRAVLGDFFRQNEPRVPLHLAIFGVLLLLMLNIKRHSKAWSISEEVLEAASPILTRPVSAALLVAMLFTRWVYPDPPIVVLNLALIALLVPLLRLMPQAIYATVRVPVLGLAALFILIQLSDLTPQVSMLRRLLVLLVAGLGVAGVVWLMRPGNPLMTLIPQRWRQAGTTVYRLALIILGTSVVANVTGYVSLAELLASATLESAYIAIAAVVTASVLEGIVVVLPRTAIGRSVRAIHANADFVTRRLITLVRLAMVVAWGVGSLTRFRLVQPVVDGVAAVLGASLSVGTLTLSLGDILAFVLVLWIAVILSRLIRALLKEDVLSRVDLPRGVGGAISVMTHYVIITFGFILAMAAAGMELSRFAILAGAFGVGLGFGLQDVVNNFVSGLILLFERPIQVGDTIEFGARKGVVKRIGIRSSTVRTFDGAEVIVPNGGLVSSEVTNWTLTDQLHRVLLPVGVAYGTDPNQVLELLSQVARSNTEVVDHPAPWAIFRGFGDSHLDFELRFWAAERNWLQVSSDVAVAVNDALKEAGIRIPFPQRDLNVRSVDPSLKDMISGIEDTPHIG